MQEARFLNAVFCDDIRQETNGKFLLVGVYGGVTPFVVEKGEYPKEFLSVYAEAVVSQETKFSFKLQIQGEEKPIFAIKGVLEVERTKDFHMLFGDRAVSVPLPIDKRLVAFKTSGTYELFGAIDDGEWTKLNELLVVLEDEEGRTINPATP
jgi:hypothetical protein